MEKVENNQSDPGGEIMQNKKIVLLVILAILFFSPFVNAEIIITGKVVGVADGDTITVLQDRTQYKIRLYGIDTPEKSQDFGNRAKQFTSSLVFNNDVKVVQKDIDRYGRIVGIVYVGDTCVNEEILRAGYAWVYHQYCNASFCRTWTNIEKQAKNNRAGLWGHSDPIPPWDYRKGKRSNTATLPGAYHGNKSSMVFHGKNCKHFNCKNCTVIFNSKEEAIKAGFRPCGMCKP
jgi:micrococcal nuclease